MRYITLSKDFHAKVSPEDYDWLSAFSWCADVRVLAAGVEQVYAVRYTRDDRGKTGKIYMHREIVNPPKHYLIDHLNGDTLDNQRGNLRLATPGQNRHNTSGFGASSYVGVTRDRGKWRARITRIDRNTGKKVLLFSSQYATELEAAQGYDRACLRLLGPYARLNFPASDYLASEPVVAANADSIPF